MKRFGLILLLVSMLCFFVHAENHLAIKAKKIVTVTGEILENGVILIKGEKIEKVGKNLTIPPKYKLHDFGEYAVYPGLINLMSAVGLSGTSSHREWSDSRERGKYNPQISTFTAFYPWGNLVHITRDFGTLITLSAPSGGTISGKAVLANLDGWSPEDMFIKKEAALIINLPEAPRRRRRQPEKKKKSDFSKEKGELKNFISKARNYYLRAKDGKINEYNSKMETMRDLWEKKLPVIVKANKEKDIKFAIQLGKDLDLNIILYAIYDGEKALKEIKASGFSVILTSMYAANREWEDGYDKVFRLPALLVKSGIKFAFSTYRSATAFDFPIQAARAVAYGLPVTDAVKALTTHPAEIIGIDNQYGSIEPGKIANIIITDGNILCTATRIKAVFVKGKKVEGKSFFQREYERAKHKISGESK